MLKTIFSKVVWVGKVASTVFGLALVFALIFGVATAAFGANGDFFKVGKSNTASAVSKLIKQGAGPALDLRVDSGPPLKVNSETKVEKLNADKLDGMEPNQLPGSIASITPINTFPGIPFDLGTSAAGFKFVGDPETGITTTASQTLVGTAEVPLGDPTATTITYDLCYRPSGGGTLTPFSSSSSSATLTVSDVVYTATSSVVPGAGAWDVGFCLVQATNDSRDAERTSYVNGSVMVVNQ
jgi:hypothetical protein